MLNVGSIHQHHHDLHVVADIRYKLVLKVENTKLY